MKKLMLVLVLGFVVAACGVDDSASEPAPAPQKKCMTPAGTFQQSWVVMTDECDFGELPSKDVVLESRECFSTEEKYEEDLGAGCKLEIVFTFNGDTSGYGGQQFDRLICNGEQKCLTIYNVSYNLH